MNAAYPYPKTGSARDRWVLERRPARNRLDPRRAYAAFVEEEAVGAGRTVAMATLFLANRECPWRCLMCDLWKNSLDDSVPRGAIPGQIREALRGLPPARRLKLYNAGSFFDVRAIPPEDHAEIAGLADPFERVVVESHPALIGPPVFRFRDRLRGASQLEVAMGLETVHPDVLPRLNKRMTLESFRRAADALAAESVGLRVFVLAGLPWVRVDEALDWTLRSIDFAFDCGAAAVSIIPTRAGNGAMDALAAEGAFALPSLNLLEAALADGLALGGRRGLVFADLWDLEIFSDCASCFPARRARLAVMNLAQTPAPPVSCSHCGGS